MGVFSREWSSRTRHQEDKLPLRGRACIIEPDDDDRVAIASLLRHMGFSTHETDSGVLGALIAEQIDLSVIVVNALLTNANGLQLIKQLRARAPSAVIIALTSDSRALALSHIAGADTVLASPPCGEALCATITKALKQADESRIRACARPLASPPRFDAGPALGQLA